MLARAGVTKGDLVVAGAFVLAALGEAVVLHSRTPGLLAFTASGAPALAVLALRRTRPALPLVVIATLAAAATTLQSAVWPTADDSGGVWMLALLLSAYSLGAHGRGPVVLLGGLLPLGVVLAIDLPSMSGWSLVSGVAFVTAFVGVLPTTVGHVVRARRERLAALERQREQVVQEQRARRESAVLAERLRTAERLQPTLLEGLHRLAKADDDTDPAALEQAARQLLSRTREEVVTLTAPIDVPAAQPPPPADVLTPLRAATQRWAALGAGAIGTGLALESTQTAVTAVPTWPAVLAALALVVPLGLVWWRPLPAVAGLWIAATAFSRLVTPIDGMLSASALALAAAFAVAALSTRRGALLGLLICWTGQIVGVGAADPLGEAVMMVLCWLGGLAVNEASRLVELSRATHRMLTGQEAVARQRAVVEERIRIAREVHDQIGHSLTVVAIQAGAARRVASTDPERARTIMATARAAARDGAIAMTTTSSGSGPAADDLGSLLQRTHAAGVELTTDPAEVATADLLDPRTRALAYRVVQEALTNVLRHAPGAPASVRLRHDGDRLTIVVRNGAGTRASGLAGSGSGLIGLRERVAACRGQIRWSHSADGGFSLQAVLPLDASRAVNR
ncbi:MAG: sensor histidine kinase [Angustibacter sp.]